MSAERELMLTALTAIAEMPDEDNEWHAAELYGTARETAIEALKSVARIAQESP